MPTRRTGRIEKHGKRWRFQVYVDGERVRRSFDTHEEATRALSELLASLEHDAPALGDVPAAGTMCLRMTFS